MSHYLNPSRLRFMDRFLDGELTPAEELFAIANAYRHSKGLREAAAYADTNERYRHTLAEDFGITLGALKHAHAKYRLLEIRRDPDFGTRRREYIYNALRRADTFPGVNMEEFNPSINKLQAA